ncbi:MAG: hypothetical protein K6E49_06150 [Lachnospiraceae bacterium]|nr:hypothetical protein [Lachnospiraceae bacterium]
MGEKKIRLRRYNDDLYVSGLGIILMGVWTVIKVFMEVFLGSEGGVDFGTDDPEMRRVGMIVLVILLVLLSFAIMRLHFYIGLNAIRSAKGRQFKKGYYTASYILLTLTVLGLFSYIHILDHLDDIDTTIASFITDLTMIYMLVIIIGSTKNIRKIKEETIEERAV